MNRHALARRHTLWTRICARARRRRSVVLAYHGVQRLDPHLDPNLICVDPACFRRQLKILIDAGFEFVTAAEFARRSSPKPPPGLIALTFDDGLRDNYTTLLPILREHSIPATVFVTTGLLGEPYPWTEPEAGVEMMTTEEVAKLAAAGIEIGAHSVTHPDMSKLAYEDCLDEMTASRDRLEGMIGETVSSFAYPFASNGPEAHRAAKDAGFAVAFAYEHDPTWPRYHFPRIPISSRDTPLTLVLKVAGAYDPVADSAPGRIARRALRSLRRRA